MKPPGRTRRRLAAMLQEKGHPVKAEDLHSVQGHHRQDQFSYRWSWVSPAGAHISISSHDTMTECVRLGFDLHPGYHPSEHEAWARHPVTPEDFVPSV